LAWRALGRRFGVDRHRHATEILVAVSLGFRTPCQGPSLRKPPTSSPTD
jgi:hypothetical protein